MKFTRIFLLTMCLNSAVSQASITEIKIEDFDFTPPAASFWDVKKIEVVLGNGERITTHSNGFYLLPEDYSPPTVHKRLPPDPEKKMYQLVEYTVVLHRRDVSDCYEIEKTFHANQNYFNPALQYRMTIKYEDNDFNPSFMAIGSQ